jgi:hypothetical protein
MNGLHRPSLVIPGVLLAEFTGCTLPAIGDIRYRNREMPVSLTSSKTGDARMQGTGYRILDLFQQEDMYASAPVMLKNGKNKNSVPAHPGPVSCKLHIYQNCERKTAVCRDIVV